MFQPFDTVRAEKARRELLRKAAEEPAPSIRPFLSPPARVAPGIIAIVLIGAGVRAWLK